MKNNKEFQLILLFGLAAGFWILTANMIVRLDKIIALLSEIIYFKTLHNL